MIDALALALDALSSGLSEEASDVRVGASATATMHRERAGRVSYVSEANHLGHNDPGAEAVAHLFEQLVSANFSLE